METSITRTDPISDLRPAKTERSHQLVYLLLFMFGLILIGLAAYTRHVEGHSWLPELTIAAGVAIAAPGILSYMYRKYMFSEIKDELREPAERFQATAVTMIKETLVDITGRYKNELDLLVAAKESGLLGVYRTRTEAMKAFLPFIEAEENDLLIIGSSLRGLLQEFDTEYEDAARMLRDKEKARIRLLLTHPIVADLRARAESRNFKDIGAEIIQSLKILVNDWKLDPTKIKLYVGTPTCFGIMTADAMLLNPYPYMKEALSSPCFIVKRPGYFYEHFYAGHFKAWISRMALPIPANLDRISEDLDAYAQRIEELMKQAID